MNFTSLPESDWQWLKSKEDLNQLLAQAQKIPVLALDLEADSMYRYHTRICLIQISSPEQNWICDPFDFEFIPELTQILDQCLLLMHGSDYDLRLMKSFWNYTPKNIWDSHMAGRFIGLTQLGLGALVQEYCQISLDKKFQKADWTKRPISPEMLDYAAHDTQFLFTIYDKMTLKLQELERFDWCNQSTKHFLETNSISFDGNNDDSWRIKNSSKLPRKGLAYLKILWKWRENLALEFDAPPFKIVANEQLLSASFQLSTGKSLLAAFDRLPRRITLDTFAPYLEEIKNVEFMNEKEYPIKPHDRGIILKGPATTRFEHIKEYRDRISLSLNLDPALLISKNQMVYLSEKPHSYAEQLLPWQSELLKNEINPIFWDI